MDNKIGPYQLGDSLGALPFGELVAATHTARRESLAFLILDERLAKDQRFRGLLRLEVARAGGVRHPALARPVEVGEQAGSLYIVIERPDDATVLSTLADDTWTPERVAALVQALAAGLDAAHDRRRPRRPDRRPGRRALPRGPPPGGPGRALLDQPARR